jgi:hypothetical protein
MCSVDALQDVRASTVCSYTWMSFSMYRWTVICTVCIAQGLDASMDI